MWHCGNRRGRSAAPRRPGTRHPDARRASRTAGPDEAGLYVDDRAALAHRRLSIVDLAAGHQPLANEDGLDLDRLQRRDLQPRRAAPRARGRGAPLPHAQSTPRPSSTPTSSGATTASTRCRGMFAFAHLGRAEAPAAARRATGSASSRSTGRAPAARLLFASEIKAMLASGLVRRRGQPGAPARAARHALPLRQRDAVRGHPQAAAGPPPGLRARASRDPPVLGHPGRAASTAASRRLSDTAIVARFRALLEESVRLRLMSDVPLGMFLSGGLDSSAIAALMATHDRPAARRPSRSRFKERAFNELEYARAGGDRDRRRRRTRS